MDVIVPIAGGLGAQILSKILYDNLDFCCPDRVFADMQYFRRKPVVANGVSVFNWELSYYGLELSDFNEWMVPAWMNIGDESLRGVLSKIYRKGPFVKYLEERSSLRSLLLREALSKSNYGSKFPVSAAHYHKAKEYLDGDGIAVVHLRRGDYLNVASHIVTDEDVFLVLNRLACIGVKKVVLISDGPVCVDSYSMRVPGISDWEVLMSDDIFFCHAVMRLSQVLVISNSQYSLSAALLSLCEDSFVVMPRQWFGDKLSVLEGHILSLSKWCVVS